MGKVSEKWGIGLCRLIKVLSHIALWCLGLGMFCLIVLGAVIPVVADNVKIGNGRVKVFDLKAEYEVKEKVLNVTYENKTYKLDSLNKIDKSFDAKVIVDAIEKFPITKVAICLEVVLLSGIYFLIMLFIATKKQIKVLKTTIRNRSPFDESVAIRLRQMSKIYLWAFLGTLILDSFLIILNDGRNIYNITMGTVLYPAIICYILAWAVSVGIKEREEALATAKEVPAEEAPKKKRTTKKKEA